MTQAPQGEQHGQGEPRRPVVRPLLHRGRTYGADGVGALASLPLGVAHLPGCVRTAQSHAESSPAERWSFRNESTPGCMKVWATKTRLRHCLPSLFNLPCNDFFSCD